MSNSYQLLNTLCANHSTSRSLYIIIIDHFISFSLPACEGNTRTPSEFRPRLWIVIILSSVPSFPSFLYSWRECDPVLPKRSVARESGENLILLEKGGACGAFPLFFFFFPPVLNLDVVAGAVAALLSKH